MTPTNPHDHLPLTPVAFEILLSVAPDEGRLLEWMQAELTRRVFEEAESDMKEAARRLGINQAELRKLLGT